MKKESHRLLRTLFIDIETVSQYSTYDQLTERQRKLWDHKAQWISTPGEISPQTLYEEKAAIYAEFGKVICISVGAFYWKGGELLFKTKSFCGFKEKNILLQFARLLNTSYSSKNHFLCGHNIREFDIPYLCRRMLINGIKLPSTLDLSGRKPWELHHLFDTMNQWKFGDYKHFTSLDLLCEIFDIDTPKSDITGSDVGRVYWKTGDIKKIQQYCEADVLATAQLFKKLNQITFQNIQKNTLHKAS